MVTLRLMVESVIKNDKNGAPELLNGANGDAALNGEMVIGI